MKKPIPFGKYYLLERINVGGMAEVFRAKAYGVEGFERLVAVKRILPNIAEDKDFITMFVDEAKIAVQLNHANIAQIFDLGVVEGAYYIALEHVFGRDLRAMFDRCRSLSEPMPIAQACFVLMKVCEGLDYAHNKRDQSGRELGLVHRDVSPQNVLVSFEGEVKVIDFGIAKAAGKGAKTQAGILKGKFGYMSPEQVRGLPIDRRSDIFSCGIVLYELLTGERLFIGESDFSTLEKVRNVEILPPSTYNRKIPDELERIVLKALSKDVEDRYQNAIDLHDELQAFVYTAGEFYSRKDLAGWMKQIFAKEIEAETAKLEQFRQIPPPDEVAGGRAATSDQRGSRRATLAMPSVAPAKRPPPPPSTPPPHMAAAAAPERAPGDGSELEWDDDELETQIYDEQQPPPGGPAAAPPTASPASQTLLEANGGEQASEPDLSSLVPSSAQWPSQGDPRTTSERMAAQAPPQEPKRLANGSNNTPSPFASDTLPQGTSHRAADEPSAVVRLVNEANHPSTIPEPFTPVMVPPQRGEPSRMPLVIAAIAVVLLLVGGGVGATLWLGASDGGETTAGTEPAPGAPGVMDELPAEPAVEPAQPGAAATDMNTGFDLIVDPAGARIVLDGADVGPAPRRVRNIAPGEHIIEIEKPGFFAKREEVTVEQGQAPTIRIELAPIDIIAHFTSEPPGARVTLVTDGKRTNLGSAPADAKLDPRQRYEVMFQRAGYVTVTKPVELTGQPEINVAVVMERASVARGRGDGPARSAGDGRVAVLPGSGGSAGGPGTGILGGDDEVTPAVPVAPPKDDSKPAKNDAVVSGEPGSLLIGSKPPCQIYLDGKDTGLMTPQRGMEVEAGTHKITLVNNEFKIKTTITVKVKPGESKKIIEDFSDRLE